MDEFEKARDEWIKDKCKNFAPALTREKLVMGADWAYDG